MIRRRHINFNKQFKLAVCTTEHVDDMNPEPENGRLLLHSRTRRIWQVEGTAFRTPLETDPVSATGACSQTPKVAEVAQEKSKGSGPILFGTRFAH